MPVVLRTRGFRFWFYAADLDEPPMYMFQFQLLMKYESSPTYSTKTANGGKGKCLVGMQNIILNEMPLPWILK